MIRFESLDGVAHVTMTHGKANAFDLELCDALTAAVGDAERSGARAVVITGQGPIFSAGVDLLRLTKEGKPYIERFLAALDRVFAAIFFSPLPVVAAINGHAIAGGCILAACADSRIAAKSTAKIGAPELLVGVPFPSLALEILRFATGGARIQELLLTGKMVALDDAAHFGLVDVVCEGAELPARAQAQAAFFGSMPPQTFALTKRRLRAPVRARWQEGGESAVRETLDVWCSDDCMSAVRAYVEKTLGKK